MQVVCLHKSRAVAAALGECLQIREGDGTSARSPGDLNVWNLDNAGANFMVCAASEGSPAGLPPPPLAPLRPAPLSFFPDSPTHQSIIPEETSNRFEDNVFCSCREIGWMLLVFWNGLLVSY
jgi:hypothetical protein